MRLRHALTDLLDEWQHNKRRNGVANKSGNDKNETAEDNEDSVQAHALNATGDRLGDGVEQTRGVDGFAKGQTTSSEDNDGPQEVVEVFLRKNAGTEEQHKRNDGHNAHVAEDILQLVAYTPEYNSDHSNNTDEPLHSSELVLHRPNRYDGGALARLESKDQQTPDQEDRDDAHRQCNEEPDTPRWLRVHVLKRNKVLWRGNR